jgi:carbon-monoxide dehydrogenase large subunit
VTTKLFGAKVARVEDQRFLRGQGRYVDDVLVGQRVLHAAVLRSPHAHARITDIDVSDVLDLDGVHLVWTHDDLTGPMAEPLPLLIPHPALFHGRTQYALAPEEVNYVGEAIAFVVAEDRYVAEDAVGRIRVSYEYLEPVVGVAAARAARSLVHDDVPDNVGARLEQENGDARAAIAAAPHTLSLDLTVERSACQPMEGRGTVARWDPDVGRMTVWTRPRRRPASAAASRRSSGSTWARST